MDAARPIEIDQATHKHTRLALMIREETREALSVLADDNVYIDVTRTGSLMIPGADKPREMSGPCDHVLCHYRTFFLCA